MARVNPALREPTYEEVAVGEPIGPKRVVADEHYQQRARFALGQHAPQYGGGDGSLVPAPMIGRDLVALFCEVYDPSRTVGLHQKEEIWFHAPVPLGTVMNYTGSYTDKYERRGKGYTVFDCEARNAETGELLVRQISTEIMRIPEGIQLGTGSAPVEPGAERVSGEWPTDRTLAVRASRDLEPGTPVRPLTKLARQDQMTVFSGGADQWYNIHTDIEVALKAGFRDTLAQGMMETCWVAEMLEAFAGPDWHTSGWIKMAYLKPVFRGDEITLRAVIKHKAEQDGKTEFRFEVWAENNRGEMTAAGWASCRIA
ncbi:Acyl dehydratase [Faunimonas pinastri]|uniref:Acyl dehydratase n=1 Tax=Faunimonas pinastri TaxID=1855383 RepID=A0A1H9ELL0_9HYPH|nr:MaoC family dehydratase [Faunimonas pinastri]SEQ26529.1 Acyl dehydratase [Faunimonas pinastri]